ncbi:MAG: ABC transporter substrate-binding protein [Patescibacteria group bacterium]|nr:ABC transporter substrate-binding protein [Patescibacteria group bacterium]
MVLSFLLSLLAFINSFIPQPTLREGIVGQPRDLYPLSITTNQPDRDLAEFIFRGLLKYDEKGNIVPDLAESYTISDDKKEYTFHLKKGVFWHNGKELTSDDVIYTVGKENLQSVSVDRLDKYTVRFRLSQNVYAPFLDLMTQYLMPVDYGGEAKPGLNQVGIGDFRIARIKSSSKVSSIILTRAWPWQKNNYKFSRIVFIFYANDEDLLTAAKLGEIDSFGTTANFGNVHNFNKVSAPMGSRSYILFFNTATEPLTDQGLRENLLKFLPKQEIVNQVFGGQAVVAYGPLEYTFVNPTADPSYSLPFNNKETVKPYNQTLSLTIPISKKKNEQPFSKIAQIIKEAWQPLGISVSITEVPLEKIFSEVVAKKDFQALLYGQEVGRDPDVYVLWHSSQKDLPGLNFTSYSSALADRSLEEGRSTNDPRTRTIDYQNFLKTWGADVPAIFLYHPLYQYYFKTGITGPNLAGFFSPADRFLNFSDWRAL